MKKWAVVIVCIIGGLIAAAALLPARIDPVAWEAPTPPAKSATQAPNAPLADLQRLAGGIGTGPEGIAIDREGRVITGFDDGRVIRLSADGRDYELLADTGGRPLGISFDVDGAPIVADARRGLLRIEDGRVQVLADSAAGVPLNFADDVDSAGPALFFSDASTRFGYHEYLQDLLEHRPHGRLLVHDRSDGSTRELARDLYFANGVALGPDGAYVLVAETSAYRIRRFWLRGEKAGTSDLFADNLPGFPDNLSFNGRDRFWVALANPRDAGLDALAPWPSLRRLLARLPDAVQRRLAFSPIKHSLVLGFDLDGHVIADLQHHAADAYAPITSVEEHGPWLYLGSLSEPTIARLPLNRVIAGAEAPPDGWQTAPVAPQRRLP